jgi:hypothetical protein
VAVLVAAVLVASSTVAAGGAPAYGADISWPQCGQGYPARPAFAVIGVNDGRPYTANPCLVSEYGWAEASGQVEFYMNTANPGVAPRDAYTYGFNAARDAYGYATGRVKAGAGHIWWLDVETGNSWSRDPGANAADIAGSLAYFRGQGVEVGIYSTRYQWDVITGGASIPSVPNWVPGALAAAQAPSFCGPQRSFSGGPVAMTQFTTQFDYDFVCPGVSLSAPAAPPPPANLVGNLLNAVLGWLRSL